MRARARATRCCSPPESSEGRAWARRAMPKVARNSSPRATACCLFTPAAIMGTATFSAAVKAGIKLNCWKTKPRFSRRKRMSSSWESLAGRRPKTTSSPELASSKPVMTLSRVVFPLPLGPTNMVSSPKRISRSMPRKAWTWLSPRPKTLVRLRERTAIASVAIRLTSEDDCWFEHQNAADANQAGQSDYQEHHHADAQHDLPGENDSAGRHVVQSSRKKSRGNAHPEGIPRSADNQRLQKNHPDDPPIGYADGFQRAKLLQVLDRENVESLPGYN